MIELSDLQRDTLGELFNIGVGRAAAALSEIVGDEVEMTAPTLTLCESAQISELTGKEFGQLSAVSQEFSGPFDAEATLVFPERNALVIVGRMLGAEVPPEELAEYEQEAMCEVGNIILNACISAIGDEFGMEFSGGLPTHRFANSESSNQWLTGAQRYSLILTIGLKIRDEKIEGNMLCLLGVDSFNRLKELVDAYLARIGLA